MLGAVVAREALADLPAPEAPERRHAERHRLAEIFGVSPEHVISLRQVHGTDCFSITRDNRDGQDADDPCFGQGDALFTREAGIVLAIRTADCLHVFFTLRDADENSLGVGLIHAGWRGLKAGVCEAALDQALGELPPETRPARIDVWIGPAISGERYEVGPEVAGEFPLSTPRANVPGKFWLNLPGNAKLRLDEWGRLKKIALRHHADFQACTLADDRFFSHRGGDAGRDLNCIMML